MPSFYVSYIQNNNFIFIHNILDGIVFVIHCPNGFIFMIQRRTSEREHLQILNLPPYVTDEPGTVVTAVVSTIGTDVYDVENVTAFAVGVLATGVIVSTPHWTSKPFDK